MVEPIILAQHASSQHESKNTITPIKPQVRASHDKTQDKTTENAEQVEANRDAEEHDNKSKDIEPIVNAILPATKNIRNVTGVPGDTISAVVKSGQIGKDTTTVHGPVKLLNNRFIRDDIGDYRRIGEQRVALSDEGVRIRFVDKQMDTFEAGVELAMSKGWETIEVAGTDKFRAEAWFHAKMQGLKVLGYEPDNRDLERLETAQVRADKSIVASSEQQQDSQQAAERFVLGQVGGGQQANIEQGRYAGKVLHQTEHHFVQDIGHGIAVIHEKSRFPEKGLQAALQKEQSLRVQYKSGQATLTGMDRNFSHSR